jgi:hypothetical protein
LSLKQVLEQVLRGWTGTSRYLSERKQKNALVRAGVEERAIYPATEWDAFVKSLRPETEDKAVVADLRIFGSRRELMKAAEQVAARGATLHVLETGTDLDMPTLRLVDRTLHRWRGESAMKGVRASKLGMRGAAAAKKKIEAGRLDKAAAERIWRDIQRYPSTEEALENMPGWTRTTAWRHFKGREPIEPPTKRKR